MGGAIEAAFGGASGVVNNNCCVGNTAQSGGGSSGAARRPSTPRPTGGALPMAPRVWVPALGMP